MIITLADVPITNCSSFAFISSSLERTISQNHTTSYTMTRRSLELTSIFSVSLPIFHFNLWNTMH